MSEDKNYDPKNSENGQNQNDRTEVPERSDLNEGLYDKTPIPKAWQPFTDETDTAPPDGGSGVGDSENE